MKIAPVSADLLIKVALVAAGLGAIWYAINRASKATGEAAAAAVDWIGETADNTVSAPIYAAADTMGIPRTSMTQCQTDMANGDTWAASFSCPLPVFIDYIANGKPPSQGGATGSW